MPTKSQTQKNPSPPTSKRQSDYRELGARAQRAEGDPVFGVVSVLYHALQGNDTSVQYAADARSEADGELARFFDDCRKEYESLATRAKKLLGQRLRDEDEDEDDEEEPDEAESEDEDDEA
ncbi:MAG TPA: hypothetical protein VHE30_13490 [Polyangiaceae bacterium]|nr:hypothetical protein [Polyangiaceae bacterium]